MSQAKLATSFITQHQEENHMSVDPQVQAYLDRVATLNMSPLSSLTPEAARRQVVESLALFEDEEGEAVARVENRTIPGPAGEIPVRIYTPAGSEPFPLLVYFHGGGWVVCDLDTHDGACRSLANGAGCVVVSVDYRLAPEHKFPAAPEDCYAATKWVAEHAAEIGGDPARLAVGGDSAGGNLAAVVSQMARDRGGPRLALQVLIFPVTDFTAQNASKRENNEGYDLSVEDMAWFSNHYLNSKQDELNPLASPMLATDLGGLPSALIITAEYDILRDEGEDYGRRLQEAGVPVTISRYAGMIHGFFGMPRTFAKATVAMNEVTQALRAAFERV
jgi:acetyl esterase